MYKPNIILLTCHDIGTHLPCYGNSSLHTPHIDALVAKATQFQSHFSTAPLCSPARSSIITGRYPHSNGMNGLTHRGFKLNDNERVIADFFNDAGYHTQLIGHQHESADTSRLHYKSVTDIPGYRIADVVQHVDRFLKQPPPQPFLLSIGTQEAHRNFDNSDYYTPSDPANIEPYPFLADTVEVRQDIAAMEGMIKSLDNGVGAIWQALHDTGLVNNTIFIFTTDHGIDFPRAKSTLYDSGIQVALIMYLPQKEFCNQKITALTSHIDILPSLLELAHIQSDSAIQGGSFVPLIKGTRQNIHNEVYAEKSWFANAYDPMRCIRTEGFKYIKNFQDGFLWQRPPDALNSLSGKVMESWRRHPRPQVELYQLESDPWEMSNCAGKEEYAMVEKELAKKLFNWMWDTDDPLLRGGIEWPCPGKKCFRNNYGENE